MLYTMWLWCAYIEEASVDVLVASHIGKMIRLWFYDTDRLWFLGLCFVFNTITCFLMLLMMLTLNNNYIFWVHTRLKHDYIVIISSHTTCLMIMKDSGQLFFHPITKTVASSSKNWHCETMLEAPSHKLQNIYGGLCLERVWWTLCWPTVPSWVFYALWMGCCGLKTEEWWGTGDKTSCQTKWEREQRRERWHRRRTAAQQHSRPLCSNAPALVVLDHTQRACPVPQSDSTAAPSPPQTLPAQMSASWCSSPLVVLSSQLIVITTMMIMMLMMLKRKTKGKDQSPRQCAVWWQSGRWGRFARVGGIRRSGYGLQNQLACRCRQQVQLSTKMSTGRRSASACSACFFFFFTSSCTVQMHTVAVIVEADSNNKHSGTLQKGAMCVMLCSIVRPEKEEESQWRSERWGFNADSKPCTTSWIPLMTLLLSELCSLLKGRWLQIVSFDMFPCDANIHDMTWQEFVLMWRPCPHNKSVMDSDWNSLATKTRWLQMQECVNSCFPFPIHFVSSPVGSTRGAQPSDMLPLHVTKYPVCFCCTLASSLLCQYKHIYSWQTCNTEEALSGFW